MEGCGQLIIFVIAGAMFMSCCCGGSGGSGSSSRSNEDDFKDAYERKDWNGAAKAWCNDSKNSQYCR